MAAKRMYSYQTKNLQGYMNLLSTAVCEWFLIFMLFVDGALSYLLTRFADYCDLETPCLLCSRIDLGFGGKKQGYYQTLLCGDHREEISSLVNCRNHDKLANIHAMCEECISSFCRSRKSSCDSYRVVVGKFGVDIEESGFKILLLSKSFMHDASGPRTCSCCDRILRAKSKAERMLQVTPVGFGESKANVKPPLPRVPGRSRFSRRDSLKRLRDKFGGPISPRSAGNSGVDQLSHVGYTELKITSDSESEVQISDDDDSVSACEKHNYKAEPCIQGDSKILPLPREVTGESGPVKQKHHSSEQLPSLLDQPIFLESSEDNNVNSLAPSSFQPHGLGELNWDSPIKKHNHSALPELISLDDVVRQSRDTTHPIASIGNHSKLSILSELVALGNSLTSSSAREIPEIPADVSGISNLESTSLVKPKATGSSNLENHSEPNNRNSLDPSTSHYEDTKELGVLAEPLSTASFSKIEEVKLLPQVLSSNKDPSSYETNPTTHVGHKGVQKSGRGNADDIDVIQMAAALARHDSAHDTVDGISVEEVEGESVLERLKRQIDYDQGCMKALYKELEEERNAAAVAANQAMAMITRLQEEKASLHMEALQYLRMMEEQAEYDMEALEKANDLLAEKEKEMQDLEAELEIYRNSHLGEPMAEGPSKENTNVIEDSATTPENSVGHLNSGPSTSVDINSANLIECNHKANPSTTAVSNLEGERIYISQCLKMLEKKLHHLSSDGELVSLQNGEYSENIATNLEYKEHLPSDKEMQMHHAEGDKGLLIQKEASPLQRGQVPNSADVPLENHLEESNHLDGNMHNLSTNASEINIDSFQQAITDLKERLETLELDRVME